MQLRYYRRCRTALLLAAAALSSLACSKGGRGLKTVQSASETSAKLAAQAATSQSEEEERATVLFESRGEDVTEAIRDNFERFDPRADGWRSEALHDLAKPLLAEFVALLVGGPSFEDLAPYLTEDFLGSTPFLPTELEQVFDDGSTRVHRATTLPEPLQEKEELPRLTRELLERFAEGDVHTKVKIFRVDLDPEATDRFEVSSIVRLDAPGRDGDPVQMNMRWRVGFGVVGADEAVRLREIQVQSYEEVVVQNELFADVTRSVFAGVPRFDSEFLLGAGDYHFRLDRRDGNAFLGSMGVALGDVNGDGLEDVYVSQHGGVPNRLFLRKPDGSIEDASESSGLALLEKTISALILDLDNDGDQDVAMGIGSMVVIAENDGTGRFEFSSERIFRGGQGEITSLSAADFDLDGDLDLYACVYAEAGPLGGMPIPYHDATNGPRNLAWRNEGGLRFRDVTTRLGFDENNCKFSFAALWEDFDADGDPDLYVANDFGRNNLYRNDRGRFTDVAVEAGADDMANGMGVTSDDFDLDGDPDLYVTNMFSSAGSRIVPQSELFMGGRNTELHGTFLRYARGNTLLANNGDGTFTDVTDDSGTAVAGWGWGSKSLDINNDGLPDLYAPNGFITSKKKDDL